MKNKEVMAAFILSQNSDMTSGYYPLVRELEAMNIKANLARYKDILLYFAADPFSLMDNDAKDDPDYRETVEYCKKICEENF